MNLSGEVENLSGYGYRYTGEQQFYSFYVNLPNGPSAPTRSDPFQGGVNLVLESRSAFLNSTLGSTLNGTSPLPGSLTSCFGSSAQITTQDSGSSDFTSVVGSFSADQVTTSCAMTLLGELEPRSANHTNHDPPMGGTYLFLSPVQAELLGLDGQALTLLPFQSPPTSPTGGPPTNDLGSAFGYVVGAFQFSYNALVTAVNFIANLPGELKALGQIILGAIEKVLSAVEAAVQWLANALNVLLQIVIAIARALLNAIVQPILNAMHDYVSKLYSTLWSLENITQSGSSITPTEANWFWSNFTGSVFITGIVLGIAILVVLTIVEGFSLGTDFVASLLIGLVISSALAAYEKTVGGSLTKSIDPGAGASGIHAIENAVNTTTGSTPSTSSPAHISQSAAWGLLATVIDLFNLPLGMGLILFPLVSSYQKGNTQLSDAVEATVEFALAFVGISMDVVTLTFPNKSLAAIATGVSGLDLGLSAYDLYKHSGDPVDQSVRQLNEFSFFLSLASTGIGIGEYLAGD